MSSDKQSAQIRSGTTADYGLGVVVWGNRAWASGGRAGASCTLCPGAPCTTSTIMPELTSML